MNEIVDSVKIKISSQLYHGTTPSSVLPGYQRILRDLHGADYTITSRTMCRIMEDQHQIVVCLCSHDCRSILSTAQASLALVSPVQLVYINNVVTLSEYRGNGFGRQVLECIEATAVKKWSECDWPLRFVLTNNPNKGNAGFYESCGYRAASTVVWEKEV